MIEIPIIRVTMRNLNNLRDYLTTPFAAFLQIDDHPALPITLTANRKSQQPLVRTHGKDFNSVEHLFHHYNKYNAGSKLNRQLYLKNECQRLLQYIIFQEGPYSRLSAAQTLELSPAEWDEMPALEPINAKPVQNAVTYTQVTKKKNKTDVNSRCDAIEKELNELYKKNVETNATINRLCSALDNINTSISTLQNVIKTLHSVNNIRSRLA